jgi:endo-1,4-beta-D-glucanase Y
MKKSVLVLLFLGMVMGLFSATKPAYPFARMGGYHDSIKISSFSKEALAKNSATYYLQWKEDFLVKEGKYYRIATDKKERSRTVSEGQGYGMMIVALMAGLDRDAQKIFDGLYRFSRAHPSEITEVFMTWQVPAKKGESDSAFDGDADIAYGLLLASKQWGDAGEINYKQEAKKIIDALMERVIGKVSFLPLLGDWVAQDGEVYNQYTTRTSDFMLSHFRAFYRVTGDKRWLEVIKQTQRALLDIQALPENRSGLVTDFIYYDREKKSFFPTARHFLEEEDDSYYYNACRVPMRVGLDALLNADAISREIIQKMQHWLLQSSGAKAINIKAGYHLDGKAIDDTYTSAVFIAPFGVAAKTSKEMQALLEDIYQHVIVRHENYFEDSINLLSQLIMIEAFWDPTTVK